MGSGALTGAEEEMAKGEAEDQALPWPGDKGHSRGSILRGKIPSGEGNSEVGQAGLLNTESKRRCSCLQVAVDRHEMPSVTACGWWHG